MIGACDYIIIIFINGLKLLLNTYTLNLNLHLSYGVATEGGKVKVVINIATGGDGSISIMCKAHQMAKVGIIPPLHQVKDEN